MSKNEPVDARIRLAIARWPLDAPRGSVTTFCAEHQISRKTFYVILARARTEGQAAALEPRSRRPRTSPTRIDATTKEQALGVRAALESSGLDYGPISVHDKMLALGLDAPSVASLARIFRETGVARAEPRKKPRAAWRRFVYPAPNACWQLDATEYVLTHGRTCVIFQLIDDHSRYALASLVAPGETVDAAIAVVKKGIRAHGVPQRLLTDNGLALNPSRRGMVGQLVTYVTSLGVEPITGKPYKPTTQGKNERIHQTLFRFLGKQRLAGSLGELQTQVEAFDLLYNTQRPHQSLPGRITPAQAWTATAKAEPPRPPQGASTRRGGKPAVDGVRITTVRFNGVIRARKVDFMIGRRFAGQLAYVIYQIKTVEFFDHQGTFIAEGDWPPPGITYIGASSLRHQRTDTDVLTHQTSPES
jgi:putative transposase